MRRSPGFQLLLLCLLTGAYFSVSYAQRVERVIDGDTLLIEGIGRVRLIGVDTPETVDPSKPVQPFGAAASAFATRTALDQVVRLDYDVERTDRFGRTLAYAYLPDGTFLNAELVRQGLSPAYTAFPFKHRAMFLALEREARDARRGLWAEAQSPTPAPTSALFFSEYIEGPGNSKALEVFNPTDAPVDLAAGSYVVQMYFNGAPVAEASIPLLGVIAPRQTFVLVHADAGESMRVREDQSSDWKGWYNGNDAVVLRQGSRVLDVIGQIGMNPGTQWGRGNIRTRERTLRRRATVSSGDANGNDAFDPASEWEGFPLSAIDGLGVR